MDLKTDRATPSTHPGGLPAYCACEGIFKSFPGVRALRDVTFTAAPGEVHALLGENGAGKSTLMAVAAGAIAPDAGTIEIGGGPRQDLAPVGAQEHGLAIVHQDPALLPDLTVAENLALAAPARPSMRGEERRAWMREQLDRDRPRRRTRRRECEELSDRPAAADRAGQGARAEPKVLILDEPTAPLGRADGRRGVRTGARAIARRRGGRLHLPPPGRGPRRSPTG